MFKTIQKDSRPNHHQQKLSANLKYLGKLVLLATTSVCGFGYAGKYLTNYLNALKSSNNNDFERMLGQEDSSKTSYTAIQSVAFNTGRKLLSDSNYRIANLYDSFQINDYAQNSQNNPSLAGLTDGKFVAAWTSYAQDGSYDGIYAKIFNNNGVAISDEFRVNNYTFSSQTYPAVAVLSNDGFVITWSSHEQDGSKYGVYAQIYNNSGYKIGGEFKVNTYVFDNQISSKVSGLSNNKFVIVWESWGGQDSSSDGVYGQIFNNDGTFIGNEFRVNTYTSNAQAQCCIASLSNNNFVVVWTSMYQDNSGGGIYAQIFDSEGAKIGREFRINQATTDNQDEPSVVSLLNDKFVVTWKTSAGNGYTWQNYGKIFSRIYSINGDPLSDEFLISSPNDSYYACPKSLSLSLENKFIISYYTDGGLVGSITSILFDEIGNNIGKVGYNIYPINPCAFAITNLSNNNFLVSWGSPFNQNQGPPYGEVLGQLFNVITSSPTLTITTTNSFSHTQTNTPSMTFSSSESITSIKAQGSLSPSFSPKNSLSPPASSSPISPSGYVVKSESSPSPSSSPLASSVKDYTSSACMNKPLLINFIKSTKTNTQELLNYARGIIDFWPDNSEENNDHTIINKFSKLKI